MIQSRTADTIMANPQIRRVEVRGHAGGDEQHHRRLGLRRAEAVRDALLKYGIKQLEITMSAESPPKIGDHQLTCRGGRCVSFHILELRAGP